MVGNVRLWEWQVKSRCYQVAANQSMLYVTKTILILSQSSSEVCTLVLFIISNIRPQKNPARRRLVEQTCSIANMSLKNSLFSVTNTVTKRVIYFHFHFQSSHNHDTFNFIRITTSSGELLQLLQWDSLLVFPLSIIDSPNIGTANFQPCICQMWRDKLIIHEP